MSSAPNAAIQIERKLRLRIRRRGGRGNRSAGKSVLDLNAHIGGILKTLAPVFSQAAPQQQTDRLRRVLRQAGPVRLGSYHRGENFRDVLALEGLVSRKHFVQHAAERPDVGAPW